MKCLKKSCNRGMFLCTLHFCTDLTSWHKISVIIPACYELVFYFTEPYPIKCWLNIFVAKEHGFDLVFKCQNILFELYKCSCIQGQREEGGAGEAMALWRFFYFYFLRSLLIVNNLSIEIIDVTINFLCVMWLINLYT